MDADWFINELFAPSYKEILDNLYKTKPLEYAQKLAEIKGYGYRVYRNDSGEHKVVAR